MSDPGLQRIMIEEAPTASALQQILLGAQRCLAHVPIPVRADRAVMARQLVHMCAERERALAEGGPAARYQTSLQDPPGGWPPSTYQVPRMQ